MRAKHRKASCLQCSSRVMCAQFSKCDPSPGLHIPLIDSGKVVVVAPGTRCNPDFSIYEIAANHMSSCRLASQSDFGGRVNLEGLTFQPGKSWYRDWGQVRMTPSSFNSTC
jgi:hypothetical protein